MAVWPFGKVYAAAKACSMSSFPCGLPDFHSQLGISIVSVTMPVVASPWKLVPPVFTFAQSSVCVPNATKVKLGGQVLPGPGVAMDGPPFATVLKQMPESLVAFPSSWKTPLESPTPPPGLLNCAITGAVITVKAKSVQQNSNKLVLLLKFIPFFSFSEISGRRCNP